MQTNELQEDANIRAVLDYFIGLTQRKNKRLVSLDRLVSLEARTLEVCSYKLSFPTVLISHLGYPHKTVTVLLFKSKYRPTFSILRVCDKFL